MVTEGHIIFLSEQGTGKPTRIAPCPKDGSSGESRGTREEEQFRDRNEEGEIGKSCGFCHHVGREDVGEIPLLPPSSLQPELRIS